MAVTPEDNRFSNTPHTVCRRRQPSPVPDQAKPNTGGRTTAAATHQARYTGT